MAIWRARSQLTGPPDHDINFWSSANSGILLERSSGWLGSRSPDPNPNGRLLLILVTVVPTNDGRLQCPPFASGERNPAHSRTGTVSWSAGAAPAPARGGRVASISWHGRYGY